MGLDTIHKLGVMHRDLKSANIFLKDPSVENESKIEVSKNQKRSDQEENVQRTKTPAEILAKLGDMNVSKVQDMKGLNYTQTGTPYYASPEVWKDEPYDNKSDIWSLGCVIYEMCALNPPF